MYIRKSRPQVSLKALRHTFTGGRSWKRNSPKLTMEIPAANPSGFGDPFSAIGGNPSPELSFAEKTTWFWYTENFNPPKLKCPKCHLFNEASPNSKSFCWFFLPETNSLPPENMGFFPKKRKGKPLPLPPIFARGRMIAISFKDWYWQNLFAQMQDQSSRQ